MKHSLKALLLSVTFSLFAFPVFSQDNGPRIPKWHSEKGYWVVESNIHAPLDHVVRFYNNDNVLLYRETLTNTRLDPSKRSVKMKLKKVLEAAVIAWEQKKATVNDQAYLAAILK
jgi:hypothetical protein